MISAFCNTKCTGRRGAWSFRSGFQPSDLLFSNYNRIKYGKVWDKFPHVQMEDIITTINKRNSKCYGRAKRTKNINRTIEKSKINNLLKTWPLSTNASRARGFDSCDIRTIEWGHWSDLASNKAMRRQDKPADHTSCHRLALFSMARSRPASTSWSTYQNHLPVWPAFCNLETVSWQITQLLDGRRPPGPPAD